MRNAHRNFVAFYFGKDTRVLFVGNVYFKDFTRAVVVFFKYVRADIFFYEARRQGFKGKSAESIHAVEFAVKRQGRVSRFS